METAEAVTAFLIAKTSRGLSARTIASYTYRLRAFARMCPALPSSPEPIEAFLAQTGPSLDNRETYFRLLRNLYRWLHRRQMIEGNPIDLVEKPKLTRKVARSLGIEELSQLLNHPNHSPAARAFLHLLADTGLRLSEALSVTDHRIGLTTITVVGKQGEREVPISPEIRQMVLQVLPWPWGSWQAAGLAMRRAFRRAGITGHRASAQTLRHTFVRLWRGDETLLVGILGWTSARMMAVYRPYDVPRAVGQHRIYSPIRHIGSERQMKLL